MTIIFLLFNFVNIMLLKFKYFIKNVQNGYLKIMFSETSISLLLSVYISLNVRPQVSA